MKRFLILIVLVLTGCGDNEVAASPATESPEAEPHAVEQLSTDEIMEQVNASGKITDAQAESLNKVSSLYLDGLTSMTDTQAERLSKVEYLRLNGLTSITDAQAECLSKVKFLELNRLTTITDAQAESLSRCSTLDLNGLTTITDAQAVSLSKVRSLHISKTLQPLIDKYKNQ